MSEPDDEVTSIDTSMQLRTIRQSLAAGKKELILALVLIAIYFYLRLTGIEPTVVLLLGILMGTWLAFRPSEWAVEGIESLSGHFGYTAYVAGMLSSLASNMPEAVVSGFSALTGYTQNKPVMLDIAVLSVLVAAGFNMLLLGLAIVMSTRHTGSVKVPRDAIKKDLVLMRWAIVALVSMFALGIVDVSFPMQEGSHFFPPEASLVLLLSYLVYAFALMKKRVIDDKECVVPHHTKRNAAFLTAIGFFGIFIAGEMLTVSIETLLDDSQGIVFAIGNPVMIAAMILGLAGSLPEHGIALIAAKRNKIDIAVGNLVGGVLQIVLLVMGGIGIFVPIPLDRYVLFQIVVIAGSLWFLKRAITDDHRLDVFEGAMIVLLQAYVFALLIWGTPPG